LEQKSIWRVSSKLMKKKTAIPQVKSPGQEPWRVPLSGWEHCQFAVTVRRVFPGAVAPVKMAPWFGIGQVGPFNILKKTSRVEWPGQ